MHYSYCLQIVEMRNPSQDHHDPSLQHLDLPLQRALVLPLHPGQVPPHLLQIHRQRLLNLLRGHLQGHQQLHLPLPLSQQAAHPERALQAAQSLDQGLRMRELKKNQLRKRNPSQQVLLQILIRDLINLRQLKIRTLTAGQVKSNIYIYNVPNN